MRSAMPCCCTRRRSHPPAAEAPTPRSTTAEFAGSSVAYGLRKVRVHRSSAHGSLRDDREEADNMRMGIFGGDTANRTNDDVVADARRAETDGFASYWLPQIFGMDAISILAIVGREVPRIELGTAVVPTYPRHPMMLAQQALTTQAAAGGRFVLGIGLSHQIVIEGMFGMSFEKP